MKKATNEILDPLSLVALLHSFAPVDLSHTLVENIPSYPTHARFARHVVEDYVFGDVARHYGLALDEHTGTHMDAPLHFIPNGRAHYGVDEIPLERLILRAARIEVTDLEPTGLLSVERIREWEGRHGEIRCGDAVLFRYGWDKKWTVGRGGRSFVAEWPGLSKSAAEYLVEREVSLVGCDTLAIDASTTEEHPAHYALLGNEIYIVENLNNLDRLSPFCVFMAFPLKIEGGSGSPLRAVALIRKEG